MAGALEKLPGMLEIAVPEAMVTGTPSPWPVPLTMYPRRSFSVVTDGLELIDGDLFDSAYARHQPDGVGTG
jgi:hypothetical protein